MDKVIKNYEEVLAKPATTRLFLKSLKHKFDAKKEYNKNLKKGHQHNNHQQDNAMPPAGIEVLTLAIVLNEVVVDLMHVQKELGMLLEQGPQFIVIPEGAHRPHQGWVYRDGEFISVEELGADSHLTRRL